MATSGTYTFNDTVLSIISGALRKVGRLGDHETLSSSDSRYTKAKAALDPLIKSYHALGMPLWAITQQEIAFTNLTTAAGYSITSPSPIRILQGYRRDNTTSDTQDSPMELYTLDRWLEIPNKEETGTPLAFNFQPLGSAATQLGVIRVWPLPDSTWQTNGSILIRSQRPFQDAGASTDNLDFPTAWNRCLIYSLAYDIAPEYGLDISQRNALKSDRNDLLALALSGDTEEGSLFIRPRKR
jgi:hypothetical protein